MKDLIRYDACKEENTLLLSSNKALRALNDKNYEFAELQQNRVQEMRLRWNECMKLGDLMQEQHKAEIKGLKKQIVKQKIKSTLSTLSGVASGVVVGLTAGLLIFK